MIGKLREFFDKPIKCLNFLDSNSAFSNIFEKVVAILIILWCLIIIIDSADNSFLSIMNFNKETNSLKVQKILPLISKSSSIRISDINRAEVFKVEKIESTGRSATNRTYYNLKFVLNSGEEKVPCTIENISEDKMLFYEYKINLFLINNEQFLTLYRYSIGSMIWDLFALFLLIFLIKNLSTNHKKH